MEQICDLLGTPRHERTFSLEMLDAIYEANIGGKYQFLYIRQGIEGAYECKNDKFKTSARPCKAMALAGLIIQTLSDRNKD